MHVHAYLAVTCHLRFWQNDRDLLSATAVTRGLNGYRNKNQHRKASLEKKIFPTLLTQGFEPATYQLRVRRSNHWAIPAPIHAGVKGNDRARTDWRAKQPPQVSCVLEDLKCWGAWDTTCGHKTKDITPSIAWEREAWKEKALDWRSPLKGRERTIVNQSNSQWKCFKDDAGETC